MAEVHKRLTGRLAAVLASLHEVEPVPARLCEAGRRMLDADGAALTLMTSGDALVVVATTDDMSTLLEDLQDSLGEGPSRLAFHDGSAQMADFALSGDVRWPMLHERGRDLGFVGHMLAVPLRPSTTVIGALTVHDDHKTTLEAHDGDTASFLSVVLGTALLHDHHREQQGRHYTEMWAARAEIHQATGMVISQVGVRPEDALALMRAQAFAEGTALAEVAREVVQRRINFRDFTIEGD